MIERLETSCGYHYNMMGMNCPTLGIKHSRRLIAHRQAAEVTQFGSQRQERKTSTRIRTNWRRISLISNLPIADLHLGSGWLPHSRTVTAGDFVEFGSISGSKQTHK